MNALDPLFPPHSSDNYDWKQLVQFIKQRAHANHPIVATATVTPTPTKQSIQRTHSPQQQQQQTSPQFAQPKTQSSHQQYYPRAKPIVNQIQQSQQQHHENSNTATIAVESNNCSINSTSPFRTATSTYNPRAPASGMHSQTPSTTESILSSSSHPSTSKTKQSQQSQQSSQTTGIITTVQNSDRISPFSLSIHQSQKKAKNPTSQLFSINEHLSQISIPQTSQSVVSDYLSELRRSIEETTNSELQLEESKHQLKQTCIEQSRMIQDIFMRVEKRLHTQKNELLSELTSQMWQDVYAIEVTKSEIKIEKQKLQRRLTDISLDNKYSSEVLSSEFINELRESIDKVNSIKDAAKQVIHKHESSKRSAALSQILDSDLLRIEKQLAHLFNFNQSNNEGLIKQSNDLNAVHAEVQQTVSTQVVHHVDMLNTSMSEKQATQESDEESGGPTQGFSSSSTNNNHHQFHHGHRSSKISNKSNVSSHKIISYDDVHETNYYAERCCTSNQLNDDSQSDDGDDEDDGGHYVLQEKEIMKHVYNGGTSNAWSFKEELLKQQQTKPSRQSSQVVAMMESKKQAQGKQ